MVSGDVIEWRDSFFDNPEPLRGALVYHRGPTPLHHAAFIIESQATALLMGTGGENYHPLILVTEAGLPAIAGVGDLAVAGTRVTADCASGHVYAGELDNPSCVAKESKGASRSSSVIVYANVGYPTAMQFAASTGAAGVGLLRTEFAVARALAINWRATFSDGRRWKEVADSTSEADAVYAAAADPRLSSVVRDAFYDAVSSAVKAFGQREVIVRSLDIARREGDPMGNRGVRRCLGAGGHTLRLLGEAIRNVVSKYRANVGFILPLVSHYSQIRSAASLLRECGLGLGRKAGAREHVSFGWEIEQPAASQNNKLWLRAFTKEFGQPPDMIGIGTNDLTQFTIALGRDVYGEEENRDARAYLKCLYDEQDFSVVRQIGEAARECREVGTRVFLLGQAVADPSFACLVRAFGIIPSVSPSSVRRVQRILSESLADGNASVGINAYIDRVTRRYPEEVRSTVAAELEDFFTKIGR